MLDISLAVCANHNKTQKSTPDEAVNNQILLTISLLLNTMESEKRVPMSPTGARCGNSPLHYGGGYFCYGNITMCLRYHKNKQGPLDTIAYRHYKEIGPSALSLPIKH